MSRIGPSILRRLTSRGMLIRWTWAIPVLLTLFLLAVGSASSQPAMKVDWTNERLSVTAAQAPLADILRAVASKTSLHIVALEEPPDEVSIQFSDRTLPDGVRLLLANVDHILVERVGPPDRARPALTVLLGAQIVSSSQKLVDCVMAEATDAVKGRADTGNDDEAIKRALANTDPESQALALDLLAQRQPQDAIPMLLEGTRSSVPEVRLRAIDLLTNSDADGATVTGALGGAVADQDPQVRGFALRALAQRATPEALGYLRTALSDPAPGVRIQTLDNIFRFVRPDQSIPLLQEAATLESDETVRSTALALLEAAAARPRQRQ